MNEPQPNRVRCEAHGLMYDPAAHSGCVVCRREEQPSEPQRTGPPSTKVLALTKSLAALALVVFVGGVYLYLDRQQAIVEADGPTEPEVGRVVAALPGIPEHQGTIMLGRTGVDQYGYPRDRPDQLTLLALLQDKRFEELSSHLESFQASFEGDFRKEQWPGIAFNAFNTADRELGPLIDEWVKTTPDSFAPYQARAEHRVALAWHYRGSKVGRLTSKKRFKKMENPGTGARGPQARARVAASFGGGADDSTHSGQRVRLGHQYQDENPRGGASRLPLLLRNPRRVSRQHQAALGRLPRVDATQGRRLAIHRQEPEASSATRFFGLRSM